MYCARVRGTEVKDLVLVKKQQRAKLRLRQRRWSKGIKIEKWRENQQVLVTDYMWKRSVREESRATTR